MVLHLCFHYISVCASSTHPLRWQAMISLSSSRIGLFLLYLAFGNDQTFLFRRRVMIIYHSYFPPDFPFFKWASGIHTQVREKNYFSSTPYALLELKTHYSVTYQPICQTATDGSNEELQKYQRGNYLLLHQPQLKSHLTLELSFPTHHVKWKCGKYCIGITN